MLRYLRGLPMRKNLSAKILDRTAKGISADAFRVIDCLDCGNCCRSMTPTFTRRDIIRISHHLGMEYQEFIKTYLKKDHENKDWINKKMPCQFLNLKDNKCSIYEVRPRDCSGFPHTDRNDFKHYSKSHKQNIMYCPITYYVVENLMNTIK